MKEDMSNPYTRLSAEEREEISRGIWAEESFSTIANRLNRSPSTVTREVWSQVNRKVHAYHAVPAHQAALDRRKSKGRKRKLETHEQLQAYVHDKLRCEWSPEEIAQRLHMDYPQDQTMRVSHETIYQYLYCLPRGALKKELMRGLRQERKRRLSRAAVHSRKQRIEDLISISERPKEAEGRTVPGHWEGDLIVGKGHASALGTLVERTTRLTLLVPLTNKDAVSVNQAFARAFMRIPQHMKKTLTYDRGCEMAKHKLFTTETQIQVYFADPYSPWQRGTNENTNGLIRQYFPKGTDFRQVTLRQIQQAEERLNTRPRKALGFYTPSEQFYQLTTGQKVALGT